MGFTILHEIFEAQADSIPGAPAVLSDGREVSYSELDRRANRLARHLRSVGVGRGSSAALLLPRNVDAYAAILAVLKVGAAYVPIDPSYPKDRISSILADSGARTLVTVSDLADLHEGFSGEVVRLDADEDAISRQPSDRIPPEDTGVGAEDLCYVIYTSGSTGRPKGVQVEHRSAVHLVTAEGRIYGARPGDRVCQTASLSFDLSVEEVWLAFHSGATLIPSPPEASRGGPDFASFLKDNRITVLSCVPTLLSSISGEFPDLRLLVLGGEACPDNLVVRWSKPGRRIFNTYGPTETTVIATYAELGPKEPVTIGRPVPGYTVHILDDSLKELPPGEIGEICIGGAGVARGYVNRPEETRARFIPNRFDPQSDLRPRLYRTGDLGRFDRDGNLRFVGRLDAQVKLRGYRIELPEIESAMMQQEGILAAACAVREDVPGVQQLVGYVVPSVGASIDDRGIRAILGDSLPAYMVPGKIVSLPELPTLPSGKVDRSSLPRPSAEPERRLSAVELPRTDTERAIAKAWASTFGANQVPATYDFFLDLGGHSLLAARMVSELRADPRFSDVSLADVYENPTVRSLASAVDARASLVPPAVPRATGRNRHDAVPRGHAIANVLQTLGLYFSFGFRALEWVTPYLVFFLLYATGHPLLFSVGWAVLSAVLVFPALLMATLLAKWLILGRVSPGRHRLWGGYHLRWWFVQSLVASLPLDYLAGTPLIRWVYRALGVRIGKDVHIETDKIRAFDIVSIGQGTTIDEEASLLGYAVEQGELILGAVDVGRFCYVGTRSVVAEGTVMEDGSRLDDLSLLPRGSRIPVGETWAGSPASKSSKPGDFPAPPPRQSLSRRAAASLTYGGLVLALPLLLLIALAPGVVVLFSISPTAQPLFYVAAVPLVGAAFVFLLMAEFVLLKWALVGRVKPGVYPVHGGFYMRNWLVDQMHSLTLDVVAGIHATQFVVPWFRALGARIGKSVELSTATSTTPDLLDVADGSTVADEVSLGPAHVEGGWMTVAPTRLGRRAFVGNSAVVPAGASLGDGTLCGVLSIPPSREEESAEPGASWLGSPPIKLPRRQPSATFTEERTYSPPRRLKVLRGVFESLRVTLPPAGFVVVTTAVLWTTLALSGVVGLVPALLLVPVVYAAASGALALVGVGAKWMVMGRYRPFEKPLWSSFIWRLELVNSFYEFLITPLFLEPLQGTPVLPAYERMMGSRIGKGVYIHTTGFLEWDLVDIGDGAALNEDCVLQTHLFEDRVLKSSGLRIGPGCDIGAYSVVLYESEMGEGSKLDSLSLLMKGERLQAGTSWRGIPARRVGDQIEVVEAAE